MKLLAQLAIVAIFGFAICSANDCKVNEIGDQTFVNTTFSNLVGECEKQVIAQIKREVEASYKYFQMGAYFAKDQVNLPGFSELFFNAAKEERDHSAVLMNYLTMRMSADLQITAIADKLLVGNLDLDLTNFSGMKALKNAHEMEQKITRSIKNIIVECDKLTEVKKDADGNIVKDEEGKPVVQTAEYHVSDFLTGDFLTEQYNSERSFAGKYATLNKMSGIHGSLAEFMFDKTL